MVKLPLTYDWCVSCWNLSVACSELMMVFDFSIFYIKWNINVFFFSFSGWYFQCMLLWQILCLTWVNSPKSQAVSFLMNLLFSAPLSVFSGILYVILSVDPFLKKNWLLLNPHLQILWKRIKTQLRSLNMTPLWRLFLIYVMVFGKQ